MSCSISSATHFIRSPDRTRGRWLALALFAMAALPVLASFGAYLYWSPSTGSNYGELIRPLPLPDASLAQPGGKTLMLSELRGRWVLVHIDSGRCGESCRENLFRMRQVRLMQGKEMARLERLWLLADGETPDSALLQSHEGLRIARAPAELLRLFPAERDAAGHVFLVDPLGNLMLRFPSDADGRRMARDIARLLKVSHVG